MSATLGGRLVRARESQNITRSQLARRLGVNTTTLKAWESDRSEPRSSRLAMLAGILNVAPTWLLVGQGEEPVSHSGDATELLRIKESIASLREQAMMIADELEVLGGRLESYQSFQDN
nr:helix-turn-helix domain-containing protein [Aliamphritea spongicola]